MQKPLVNWIAGCAVVLASCATPMTNTPLTVTLATATPGGGFPVYGAAFAESIHEADPTITIQTQNTKGSAENIPLLEAGKVDLGLVQGEAAYEALAGIGRSAPAKLKIVAAMYSSPGMFVVRADSPYRSIADLKGKSIAWGAKGSGLVILAAYTLDALGLDRDRDFQGTFLERAGDGPGSRRWPTRPAAHASSHPMRTRCARSSPSTSS
jgi:TRAP transporter TAXI family solute receptor